MSCNSKNLRYYSDNTNLIIEEIIQNSELDIKFQAGGNVLNKSRLVNSFMKSSTDFKNTNEKQFENIFLHIGYDGTPNTDEVKFLNSSDYKNFVVQYENNTISELSDVLKKKYRNSTMSEIIQDRKNNIFYEHLEFSKPFFSKNNQIAYIEVNYYSEGTYGDGNGYILKKTPKGWKIVRVLNLWIS